MSQPHRAQHRQSEGDYYAETAQKLHGNTEGQQLTEKAASNYSVAQGKLLQAGQNLRGDSPAPGENYANSPHELLYDMVHKDLDIEGINNRSRVANVYGNWLADASNQFRDAATTSGGSWQGPAAQQANTFFQSTAGHTEQTGDAMQLVSNHYSQQSAAAHYAKTNMPEPTGFNQQAELDKARQQYESGNLIGMNTTMVGIQAKQQQADAAHQQAVQVLQNLDSTYHETASTQPTYTPPPQLGQGDSTSASGFHGTSSSSFSGTPSVGGTGPGTGGTSGGFAGGPGAFGGPGGPSGPGGPAGTGALGGPGGSGGPGATYIPPGTTSGTGTFSGNSSFRATPAAGGFGRVTPDGLAMPGTTAGGSSGGGDVTRGKGIGSGRAGTGFAGSRVSGSAGTAPKETPAEGGKSGSKPGERLERGATAAAAAKGGKGGAAGAAGGAGKKKEDDKEHKNKYAVDEEVFDLKPERGPDGEKIVKPTIGETS
ncbi:hypothetical protein AMES_8376 [Amycolatopsis mediterranei S699]|uniref:PPE family domain-containing protein n=1 Tax=Amycolatopsis mediterranei (strain U-32) TaxID=749927 RepID=A0A0H3DHN3_AMYMU|nr:hypothetical protein [Amycolatopsis mediterranei]ADJ50201.1 conserved hypothetical protein [Amycolatopsis mediterranei U32]AFO81909.1 hypothetical protein AMES_8376 [Amycolatopsis mediterranei S699]AGT89038.1 hypothetical protein B737_8377 [Amycolatopsis mediterranei RB]KDO07550.1 hypothetical protein DV26_24995 [Amycolatopsis mediterranei]KDU93555.1 hypothetical protein DV36_05780 [Amycolatopsis mediterranei]